MGDTAWILFLREGRKEKRQKNIVYHGGSSTRCEFPDGWRVGFYTRDTDLGGVSSQVKATGAV